MRNALSDSLTALAKDPAFVFLTGDLGFNALEPLQKAAGERFINAGVAEQNMVTVAAGLASVGLHPWVYSIAPFIYARPFEQIRNDVCLHDLPVRLIGNGGGYGYGVMGGTHHAIEDYGALLCLPNMRVFVPAFSADVRALVARLARFPHPCYLRLGRDELPPDVTAPGYAPWRCLVSGGGGTLVAIGPVAGRLYGRLASIPPAGRPNLWVVAELPLGEHDLPAALLEQVVSSEHLVVVEEHVEQGSVAQALAHRLMTLGVTPKRFTSCHARGYLSGRYGSQDFHRKECGLDVDSICNLVL